MQPRWQRDFSNVKQLAVVLSLVSAMAVPLRAQVFWASGNAGLCPGPRLTVAYGGNPSFRLTIGGGGGYFRPWTIPCQPWGGFWPGNYWLGPVSFVSPNARRLPSNLGPAPTVPDPVAILPTNWVPQ